MTESSAPKLRSLGSPRAYELFIACVVLIATPLIFLLVSGFTSSEASTWDHIVATRLPDYLLHTFLVALYTIIFASLFALPPAWILSRYRLKGALVLDTLLVIPLAIPKYLMAYAYAGLFDFGGWVSSFLSLFSTGFPPHFDILNPLGLSFVLACALFPYIYIAARLGFGAAQSDLFEASLLLGRSTTAYFFKILLPLALPAILGGMSFVIMETVGDYGASYYFGVDTLSTGIFRTWFGLNDIVTAFRLSLLLTLCVISVSLVIFSYGRSHKLFIKSIQRPLKKIELVPSFKSVSTYLICLVPIFLGTIFPVAQLLKWSYQSAATIGDINILTLIFSSAKIAILTAIVCLILALLLLYAARLSRPKVPGFLTEFALYGYTLPGVVLAISLLGLLFGFSKTAGEYGWDVSSFTLFVSASSGVLVIAGAIRFLAIAFRPLQANDKKVGYALDAAAHLLGASRLKRVFLIHLPLQKRVLLTGGILVFIDMMKELPLTLLLKPYGVNTLATKAYEFASDEMISKAAIPGLVLVLFGIIPVIWIRMLAEKTLNDE